MSEMFVGSQEQPPQSEGSALTYKRRYSLSALLGLASEEDDDAEGATDISKDKKKEVISQPESAPIIPAREGEEPKASPAQLRKIFAVSKEKGYAPELATAIMIRLYNTGHSKELAKSQASDFIDKLTAGYGLKQVPDESYTDGEGENN